MHNVLLKKLSLLGLVVLVACPKEQVGPVAEGSSGGGTSTGPGVVTSEPTPTSGASSGTSSGGAVETSSTGSGETSTGALASSGSTGEPEEGSSSSSGSSGEGSSSTGEVLPLFDCFGCTCDASVSFCRKVFAGFAGPGDPMCPIVEPGGFESGCVLYPRECDPPSCACLPLMDNKCFCNESERQPGAFEVTCPLL